MVNQFIDIFLGINLQIISNILSNISIWPFTIAKGNSYHLEILFFDI